MPPAPSPSRRHAACGWGGRAALALLLGVAACAPAAPMTSADRAALGACRLEADRTYAQQNRYLLSERSQRDSPLSSSGTLGVTSAGLGQLYGRDQDVEDCLRSRRAADRNTQPGASGGFSPQMDPTVSNGSP